MRNLQVALEQNAYVQTFDGTALFQVFKPNTTKAVSLRNNLAEFWLSNFREGETTQITLGATPSSGTCSVWSYTQPTSTSSTSTDNYASFSMYQSGSYYENIRMLIDGSVSVPTTLTANTLSATNWIGLPQPNLAPITLDPVNNRVGINTTSPPDETLQVGGDCHVDNQLRCTSVLATDGTFTSLGATGFIDCPKIVVDGSSIVGGLGAPTDQTLGNGSLYLRDDGDDVLYVKGENGWKLLGGPTDLTPITLDKTNNRVGIGTTTPIVPLDVVGNINTNTRYDINGVKVLSGTGLGSSVVNSSLTSVGTLTGLTVSGSSILSTLTVKSDPLISLIKTDTTNNRVGILTNTPNYTLDVNGTINATAYNNLPATTLSVTSSVVTGNTYIPAGNYGFYNITQCTIPSAGTYQVHACCKYLMSSVASGGTGAKLVVSANATADPFTLNSFRSTDAIVDLRASSLVNVQQTVMLPGTPILVETNANTTYYLGLQFTGATTTITANTVNVVGSYLYLVKIQ